MIQANILLPLAGKTSEPSSVMDLMRLPLGILTGVGFIGGGTILKGGVAWKQPEQEEVPLDLLRIVENKFELKAFELTTDGGR